MTTQRELNNRIAKRISESKEICAKCGYVKALHPITMGCKKFKPQKKTGITIMSVKEVTPELIEKEAFKPKKEYLCLEQGCRNIVNTPESCRVSQISAEVRWLEEKYSPYHKRNTF